MARQFGKIQTSTWQSRKFHELSDDARLAWFYVQSCPHGNAIGAFVLPVGYAAVDMKWPIERVERAFAELTAQRFLNRSERVDLTIIPDWWDHNIIENPNVAKAALNSFLSLPDDPILSAAFRDFSTLPKSLAELFRNQFPKGLPNSFETKEPSRDRAEPEIEIEPEIEPTAPPPGVQQSLVLESISQTKLEDQAVQIWNDMARHAGLSAVQKLTATRRSSLKRRLADCGGIEGWRHAAEKVATIPGLLGKANGTDKATWRMSFDDLINETKFTKLMEGGYDGWGAGVASTNGSGAGDRMRAALDQL